MKRSRLIFIFVILSFIFLFAYGSEANAILQSQQLDEYFQTLSDDKRELNESLKAVCRCDITIFSGQIISPGKSSSYYAARELAFFKKKENQLIYQDPLPPHAALFLNVDVDASDKVCSIEDRGRRFQNSYGLIKCYIWEVRDNFCCCRDNLCFERRECLSGEKQEPFPSKAKDCSQYETKQPSMEATGISPAKLKAEALEKLNPGKYTSVPEFIGTLVGFLSAIIGTFALVMFIWAGVLWMTAVGNAEKLTLAKKIFVWTCVGVAATLAIYMATEFLFKAILG